MKNNRHKSVAGFLVFVCLLLFTAFAASEAKANPNANVEAIVRASFPDMPGMTEIAKCESGFRQFNADGTALRGGAGKNYIGIFQIDERLHRQRALDRAYDINTIEGNIAYARYMYFNSGTNPWKSCLPNPVPAPNIPQPTPSPAPSPLPAPAPMPTPVPAPGSISTQISLTLKLGMSHAQVMALQQILNQKGFTLASSGPGSQGNETLYFGSLTREAVRRFQCAKNIVCSGDESSTGFGLVGPRTRAALME